MALLSHIVPQSMTLYYQLYAMVSVKLENVPPPQQYFGENRCSLALEGLQLKGSRGTSSC